MYKISVSKQLALDKMQNLWKRADTHPSTIQFRKNVQICNGFYDGTAQWRPEDIATLQERQQLPMVINFIRGKINSLSGVEIQSRYRTACRSDSGREGDEELAKALTHYLFYIQQDQRMPYRGSLKFRDMLKTGIGWSQIYKENGKFYYEYVNSFNMMPDPDDLTEQLTEMKFVCRKRWMSPDKVKKIWPHCSSYIDSDSLFFDQSTYSPEVSDRSSNYTGFGYQTSGANDSRLLISEVQYKEAKKAYSGLDNNGFYFETFDEDKAEKISYSKNDIEEIDADRRMRGLFLNDCLLEHHPFDPDIPNLEDFTYIPCILDRLFKNGVPYGLINSMLDLQRDLNNRFTKANYLANSSRVIIEGTLSGGLDPEDVRRELKRADSVIQVNPGTKLEIRDNAALAPIHLEFAREYQSCLQSVTGIYDDLSGKETNATSGVAQKQRQIGSIRNNVFMFDSFSDMKTREAKFILGLIQGGAEENLMVNILTPEERKSVILNLTKTIKGKQVVLNDVSTLPVSLYVEEVPDVPSSFEENRTLLENLLSNPNGMLYLRSAKLLRKFGFRASDAEEIANDFKELNQQEQMAQQKPSGDSMEQANPSNFDPVQNVMS